MVQWLGLSTITAEGPGRTPDRGTKIAWWAKKNPQLLGMIWPNSVFKGNLGDFLVIQWLRIHLPLDKGTQVRSLVRKLRFHILPGN